MPDKLIFNPDDHTYKLITATGEVPLPCVTRILDLVGLTNTFNRDEEAAQQGRYVHQACHLLNEDNLEWETLDQPLIPYVMAYQKFLKETGFEVKLSEHKMYHKIYKYAGTIDIYGYLDGKRTLVDLKTGSPTNSIKYQMAAYKELLNNYEDIKCEQCFPLFLKDSGKYNIEPIKEVRRSLNIFLSALVVVQARKEK